MRTEFISQKTTRRLLLHAQLLDRRTKLGAGTAGVAKAIDHLGYVQIDSISVIERAHQHTLWTRVPGYRPEHLHQAQAVERSIFEYWGHAASYLPMGDYRFYLPMMRSFYDPANSWYRGWAEKFGAYLAPVLERVRAEGPLASRDFENPISLSPQGKGPWWDSTNHPPILADPIGLSPQGKGPWWDWKPAKAALELLFWRGELMVRERRGFERVYDLTERVLPSAIDTRPPAAEELGRFIVVRALTALGVAGEMEIRDYIRIGERKAVSAVLMEMQAANEIVGLKVEGQATQAYALPALLEAARRFRTRPPRVTLLSPFDNLVISRLRLKQRFDFDYTLECYVPKGKRTHGYFVLPVLFGEEIVGRLDPKAERISKTFLVRRLAIAPGHARDERLVAELGRALGALARFNGCERIVLENVQSKKFAAALNSALAAEIELI